MKDVPLYGFAIKPGKHLSVQMVVLLICLFLWWIKFLTDKSPHHEPRWNFPILRNKQIQNVYKNQKIRNIYKFFIFSSDILQKGDLNQMKRTWAMYFLQSLPRHLLGFHDLLLFLNLFNKIQFFILFSYACCSVDAHYLKIIFVEFLETCFCGFTKLSRLCWIFLYFLTLPFISLGVTEHKYQTHCITLKP